MTSYDFLENYSGYIAIALLSTAIGMLFTWAIKADNRHERLMIECMADNHKEYQCESMLKTDTIIIPTGK